MYIYNQNRDFHIDNIKTWYMFYVDTKISFFVFKNNEDEHKVFEDPSLPASVPTKHAHF